MVRPVAGVLAVGSVIAFLVGIARRNSFVQVAGGSGFILEGRHLVVGALVLAGGSIVALAGLNQHARTRSAITLAAGALGIGLIAIAGVMFVTLSQTPIEFCGSFAC